MLSGGEKKRLHLMKVLIKNPNFLILDEPTNDLDIDTLNVLEEFLENYPGVLVLVSHDRYLVDKLTDQLFVMEGEGIIRIFNGNYSSYREEQEEIKIIEKENAKKPAPVVQSNLETKQKLSFAEKRELQDLELEIEKLEALVTEKTTALNSSDNNSIIMDLSKEIDALKSTTETKTDRWLLLLDKVN